MALLVQKFGGSSVADLEKLRLVAQKIVETRRAGHDLVVVVSAMGSTTDDLLEMAHQLSEAPSKRELDMLLSVGERISMALLSMAVQDEGFEAVSLTGSQCGIITTDSHSNARIMDVRPFRVQDELQKGRVVIVAGYQGTSYRREVTTLGRGGSDTTAVALAAALGAEACEIYSDVDGVFSADPRVVLNARQLAELSHEEMLELAVAGARVLNRQAVEFAKLSNIALYAKSTHDSSSKGTIVRPDGFHERAQRAEANKPQVAVAHIDSGIFVSAQVSADETVAMLQDYECVCIEWAPGASLKLFINPENIHDTSPLKRSLEELGNDVTTRDAGLVSLVGDGIGASPRWVHEGLDILSRNQLAHLAVFVHQARISIALKTEDVDRSANLLHDAFA